MKTIKLNVYRITELPADVKEKIIEKNRYINVEYDWWQFAEEEFCRKLGEMGIYVNEDELYFDLRERYLYFKTVSVDLDNHKLLQELCEDADWHHFVGALSRKALMKEEPVSVSDYLECTVTWGNEIYVNLEGDTKELQTLLKEYGQQDVTEDEICYELLPNMEEALASLLRDLRRNFLKELTALFYKLISDEAVIDTLESNDYYYTKEGIQIFLTEDETSNLGDNGSSKVQEGVICKPVTLPKQT